MWLVLVLLVLAAGHCRADSCPDVFQIIRPDEAHASLELVEDGLGCLEALDSTISLVGVVGSVHTGKSFLLSALNHSTSGFTIGPTHEATTMGIWIGMTSMMGADGSRVLLLDTEGFSAAGVNEAFDAQIFATALMLSSHLVYNSVKLITAAEVEYLETLARRAHLWRLRDVGISPFRFPPLTWVVEDFCQDLLGATPIDWLMSFLGERDMRAGRRPLVEGNYTLASLFEDIGAHTLFLPAFGRQALRNLSSVAYDDLDKDFLSQLDNLRRRLLEDIVSISSVRSGKLSGRGMSAFLRVLVNSLRDGHFPSLPSLWSSWEGQLLSRARADALTYHSTAVKLAMRKPPMPPADFAANLTAARIEAERIFRDSLFGLEPLWRGPMDDLQEELSAREVKDFEINDAAVDRELDDAVEEAVSKAEHAIERIPLPLLAADLDAAASEHVFAASEFLSLRIGRYATSVPKRHARALRRLAAACKASVTSVKLASAEEESKILSRAVSSGLRTYDLEMTASTIRLSAGILPISAREIESLDLAARHAALIDFDRSIISPRGYETEDSDASTPSRWLRRSDTAWMLNTSAAAMHRDHAEKGMLGKGEDWKRRNEAAATGKCEIVRKGIVVDFETETDHLALPDLEDPLRNKVEQIMSRHTKAFATKTANINDTAAYDIALMELNKIMSEHTKLIMEQNTRRWHQSLAPVSVAAVARMRLNVSCASAAQEAWSDWSNLGQAAWICYRDSLPWVCDAHAIAIWIEEFDSARHMNIGSRAIMQNVTDSMVREVAGVFLKADLAWHRDIVRSRFNALVAVFVMLVTGGMYMFWQGICSRRREAKTGPVEDSTAERISAAASRPAPWVSERDDVAFEEVPISDAAVWTPDIVFSAAAAPLPNVSDESMDLCEGRTPSPRDALTVEKMLTQISLVSKDDAQAGRFFSDLHADPAVNRLIEKAGWTKGDHSRQTPRHIASLHEKCLDYVRARTSFDEDAWRRLDYVDGVLSKYTNRV